MSKEHNLPWRKFEFIMSETYEKVKKEGDLADLEVWKRTFPEVEFEEVDEDFTGKPINWGERSLSELAFYVNYMQDPSSVEVSYILDVDGHEVWHTITDSEMMWYLWFHGCFKTIPNKITDDEAKEVLFGYTISGPYQEFLSDSVYMDDVEVLELDVRMRL